jgi:hypothetical protein
MLFQKTVVALRQMKVHFQNGDFSTPNVKLTTYLKQAASAAQPAASCIPNPATSKFFIFI